MGFAGYGKQSQDGGRGKPLNAPSIFMSSMHRKNGRSFDCLIMTMVFCPLLQILMHQMDLGKDELKTQHFIFQHLRSGPRENLDLTRIPFLSCNGPISLIFPSTNSWDASRTPVGWINWHGAVSCSTRHPGLVTLSHLMTDRVPCESSNCFIN